MLPQSVLDMIHGKDQGDGYTVKRGEEIFEGTDYPRDWAEFVGQEDAKEQLQVAAASALHRRVRIDHVLIESGMHGVGKTTIAKLLAATTDVGILECTGPIDFEDGRKMLLSMQHRDIWFIDEAHRLTAGNRSRSDWLLPFMTDGHLLGPRGAIEVPDVTLVAATTEAGKLNGPLRSRFMLTPELVPYSPEEGARICEALAERMRIDVPVEFFVPISVAADQNPRMMRKILTKVRDLSTVGSLDLGKAFRWAGVSYDGLTTIAREILLLLLLADNNTLGLSTIQGKLSEPGPIGHHEQQLLQRQLVDIVGRGRKLTPMGLERAQEEAEARR